jgi:hypothetical protein
VIRRRPAVQQYPPTIGGSAEDHATGATTPLVARRTGETDEDGCEIYVVEIPLPGIWFATGRVGLHFDMVPGRSSFTLQFQSEER